MSSEEQQHGFTLPGADLPAPDADLRARREAVVMAHTIAEMQWDLDGVFATFPRGPVYRIQAFNDGPLVGADAIRKGYFDDMQRAFPHLEHDLHAVHHTPSAVIIEAQARGKQVADWRDIPNRGKSIDAPVLVVFHFDGDVLVDETLYFDIDTFRRQLG